MAATFAVTIPMMAGSVSAQTREYRPQPTTNYRYKKPGFYRRHRNMSNILIATGAGALLGGLIGGRRGVGLGALAGAGSGALYTYKLNKKVRRY